MWKDDGPDELNASYLTFQVLAEATGPKATLLEETKRLANKLALGFGEGELRARPDAAHELEDGTWLAVGAMPQRLVIRMGQTMTAARFVLMEAAKAEVERTWASVIPYLKNFQGWANVGPAEDFELRSAKHWATAAAHSLSNVPWRFANAAQGPGALKARAEFFQQDRHVTEHAILCFDTARVNMSSATGGTQRGGSIECIQKAAKNDCYIHMKCPLHNHLTYKPPDADRKKFSMAQMIAFAGNPEGRRMARANDILGLLGKQDTRVCLCHVWGGGNSKSLLPAFRRNVFSETHKHIPPTCFENGGRVAPMVNLRNTAFNWACNNAPHAKAPDTLKLDFMTRRSRILNVQEKRFEW
ncbi:unnamed protein product [Prorocentrum cordatum]|uniref:Uncharacterized protein n=1 Tax=Prorocentrum cordatum TaxID=2364126 RepID=A0ABN9UNT7_9DINO|nr:unnamed protein product [Polarella glacialis]